MEKITVVVPTHNSQQWITETLESVRAQTYPREKIETIVVDDGSSDASAAIARSFLVRHAMQGTVLVSDQAQGVAAAMNLGWQAATGDWIQFLKGQDLLAPNKIEVQTNLTAQLTGKVGVICSSWQRLCLLGDQWLLTGPIYRPELVDPVALKLVSPRAGRLGAALFRKESIQAVAGFCEQTSITVDEQFMLTIAGIGESLATSRVLPSGIFVEAPSSLPLFFERQGPAADARRSKVAFARQHLENVLIARAALRDTQRGTLTPANIQEIANLISESLRDLHQYDRAAFSRCSRRLREIDPSLIPTQTAKSQKLARVVASMRHWIISSAATFSSAILKRIVPLRYQIDRAWHVSLDLFRAIARFAARHASAIGLTKPTHRALAMSAPILMAAIVLLSGMLTSYPFGRIGSLSDPTGLSAQKLLGGAPTINVASSIYAEPSSSWPMPIEIGPPHRVPPDSVLKVRGLPATVTLSEGRRVSTDVWAVPLAGLSNLELFVAQGVSGRPDLTLMLVQADGKILAEARTVISINETTGITTTVVAADLTSGKPDHKAQEFGQRSEVAQTLPDEALPMAKPEPSRASTKSSATKLPARRTTAEPSSEQAPPLPVGEMKTASLAEPTATPVAVEPSIATPPSKLDTPPEVEIAPKEVGPPQLATPAKITDNQEAALQAPADRAIREVITASIAIPELSQPTAPSIPVEPGLASTKTNQNPRTTGAPLTQEERQRVEKMIMRGERELADGNISVARQFFLRAAEADIARGAFLLASTYDLQEFARLRIQGVQPNSAEARKWYRRARDLGATEAEDRLLRLGAAE